MNDPGRLGKTITDPKQVVAIVTDSVAQVPAKIARQLGITVIPFRVQIGEQSYLDGIDLVPAELYRRMRLELIVPTTAAPSPWQYQEAFHKCLRSGAQAVLCVTLSSKLSSSNSMASLAAEEVRAGYPGRTIEVLDSQQAAIAQGFVAIAAARAAAEGKLLPEVLETAREATHRAGLVVTFETLKYLARGGRIGKASYLLGSLINIKPVLTLGEGGILIPLSRVRGENHALRAIVDYTVQQVEGYQKLYLAVLEADAAEQAAQLEAQILEKIHPSEIYHSELTPVMGVHTGPGLVGLGYYYE